MKKIIIGFIAGLAFCTLANALDRAHTPVSWESAVVTGCDVTSCIIAVRPICGDIELAHVWYSNPHLGDEVTIGRDANGVIRRISK